MRLKNDCPTPVFRTLCRPSASPRFITHSATVLTLGSCFADEVAARMRSGLFDVVCNPLGTLYNPASIAACARRLAARRLFTEADLFEHQGRLHTFHTHSSLSCPGTPAEALARLNGAVERGADALRRASVVIITLGTAWVFATAGPEPVIVANCHKLPAARFTRFRLTPDRAAAEVKDAIDAVRQASPAARVVLTVSPIRHLADGLHGNSLSKATLLLAAEEACRDRAETYYFDAYEAVCDDLRDYRFYAADMTHPSPVAVDYVYSLFSSAFITPEAAEAARECEALTCALAHRQAPGSDPDGQFAAHVDKLRDRLLEKYPYICSLISQR